jgi:Ser/Thr protein kinase RdoA (MazF antagonist)
MAMTDTLIAEAQEAAALWNATVLRLILARENAVFEIALPDGDRAALRLHRRGYQGAESISSELWWCTELALLGLPVPRSLESWQGRLLETLASGRHASVVRWLDGVAIGTAGKPFAEPVAVQVDRHFRLGQLLRRIHEASDSLTVPEDFFRPSWDAEGLVGEAPFWGRFWDHPAALPEQTAVLIAARDVLRAELVRFTAANGNAGLIHADVLRENVLVSDSGMSLIDFDDSGFGFRLYDLGTVLSQNQYEPARDALRDALMAGYGTTALEMVELFTMARTMASVGWTMPRLAADDPIHQSHLHRAVMCARRVLG